MLFAVNYSEPAGELTAAGKLAPDRFKCPPWPGVVQEASTLRPVYVHFSLNAGTPQLRQTDWAEVERLLDETETPYLNLHLAALNRDFPDIPVQTEKTAHTACITNELIRDVSWVCDRFGADRVIVENIPYRGTLGARKNPALKILRPAAEPSVITTVVRTAGCGLLLDLNHARMAAYYMNLEPRDYLRGFPLHRLRELHVAGGFHDGERFREHMPMTQPDWDLLAWALENTRKGAWSAPWALAFEYGRVGPDAKARSRPDVLAEQIPRLQMMIGSSDS